MSETISPNSTIAQYNIVSKIGEGGMGEVYLAQDTKLDRKVAIKFLKEELGKDANRLKRFIQEAKAASALNHPNILTVYEIGDVDGTNYIATEFIDGHTLREHLAQNAALPLNTILKIGVQVAEALSAAHAVGIIHRDIKPDNIMIRRDGYAKVLDFGLAKLSQPPGAASGQSGSEDATRVRVNTTPGMVMGTVNYMSPEQARGVLTDARTDIWSLGVVLYEMLARRVPFTGETVSHIIVAILEKEPALLENVPPELQRIVRKALTKDVEMRYQSAHDLLIDLKNLRRDLDIRGEIERSVVPNQATAGSIHESQTRILESAEATRSVQLASTQNAKSASSLEYAVTQAKSHKLVAAIVALVLLGVIVTVGYFAFASRRSSASQIDSIAVMPFVNESGNADVEYLSDGMTETLISSLSRLPNLTVKARSAVFRYKGKGTDTKTIGKELNAQAILNGRVAQRGDQLTVSLELIDSQTENVIWADKYDRRQTDLVSLQNEIARDVLSKLKTKLSGIDEQKLAKTFTTNPEAFRLLLQGRFFLDRTTREDTEKAIGYFRQALDFDRSYALCWADLGRAYAIQAGRAWVPASEGFDRSREATKRALSLDPDLAEGHAQLGRIQATYDLDLHSAEASYRRALELAPTSSAVLDGAAVLSYKLGRFDEAVEFDRRALVQDPLNPAFYHNLGLTYFGAGRLAESEQVFRRALELAPQRFVSNALLATVLMDQGRADESLQQAMHEPDEFWRLWALALIYHRIGRNAQSDEALGKLTAEHAEGNAFQLAEVYAMRGETDRAFEWLERAYQKHDSGVTHAKVDPYLRSLHGDPRWASYLKKLGFEA